MSKIIYIDGQAPNASGYSQLQMSAADKAAVRAFGMISCLSSDGFYRQAGDLRFRDVKSGGDGVLNGSPVISDNANFSGKRTLDLNEASSAKMPNGSADVYSFTVILALSISSADSGDAIIAARYNSSGTRVADWLRYNSLAQTPGIFIIPSATNLPGTAGATIPLASVPLDQPFVLTASFDAVTGRVTGRINSTEVVSTVVTGTPVEDALAYLTYGFQAPAGLVGSIARSYVYQENLLANIAGKADVVTLEQALLSEYT